MARPVRAEVVAGAVILTKAAADQVQRDQWTAPPEVQHALDMEVLILVAEPGDGGPSTLRQLYIDFPDFVEQRNLEAEKLLSERLARRFPDQAVFCKADLHDNGGCRFWLRVAETLRELQHRPSARADHNENLLKPHEEWVKPPKPELMLTQRVQGHESAPSPTTKAQVTVPAGGSDSLRAPKPTPMSKKLATRAAPPRTQR